MRRSIFLLITLLSCFTLTSAQKTRFKVIALYENGGHHVEYSKAAKISLNKLAAVGQAMINVTLHGFEKKILEVKDIVRAANIV